MATATKDANIVTELQAELDRVKAENAALAERVAKRQQLSCKVGPSGGISVYGINSRRPVTLYGAQWVRLAEYMPEVLAFAKQHWHELNHKDETARSAVNRI